MPKNILLSTSPLPYENARGLWRQKYILFLYFKVYYNACVQEFSRTCFKSCSYYTVLEIILRKQKPERNIRTSSIKHLLIIKKFIIQGTWVAQSVKPPDSWFRPQSRSQGGEMEFGAGLHNRHRVRVASPPSMTLPSCYLSIYTTFIQTKMPQGEVLLKKNKPLQPLLSYLQLSQTGSEGT